MRVSREDGHLAGRIVHADAKHGEAAGGELSIAEQHAHLASLSSALEFEVSQTAIKQELSDGRRSRTLKNLQRDRGVRRHPGHAAIFKLNLDLPAVSGG
jgi:hypothetical protein